MERYTYEGCTQSIWERGPGGATETVKMHPGYNIIDRKLGHMPEVRLGWVYSRDAAEKIVKALNAMEKADA